MTEREWVKSLVEPLGHALTSCAKNGSLIRVEDRRRLLYAHEVQRYRNADPVAHSRSGYETDLLVMDVEEDDDEQWTPRLIVEAKVGSVTTHDALTYSTKASTHKHVHPYLRYGILIGNWGNYAFPARLFRHGAYFDFMMTLHGFEPSERELATLVEIIADEIETSRKIQQLLTMSRRKDKHIYHAVHRPLRLLVLDDRS